MAEVGMHEAKTTLSKLVERAHAGEEIVITRRGQPVARLEPVRKKFDLEKFEAVLRSVPPIPQWQVDAMTARDEDIERMFGVHPDQDDEPDPLQVQLDEARRRAGR